MDLIDENIVNIGLVPLASTMPRDVRCELKFHGHPDTPGPRSFAIIFWYILLERRGESVIVRRTKMQTCGATRLPKGATMSYHEVT